MTVDFLTLKKEQDDIQVTLQPAQGLGSDCIGIWGAAFQAAGHAKALGQTEFEGSEQQWGGQGAWSKAKAAVAEVRNHNANL